MGTCDFFHQWTQTHPSRVRWGRGVGRRRKKKKLLRTPSPNGVPGLAPGRRRAHSLVPREPSDPPPRPLGRSPPPPGFPSGPGAQGQRGLEARAGQGAGWRRAGCVREGRPEPVRPPPGSAGAAAGQLRGPHGGSGQAPRRAAGARGGWRGGALAVAWGRLNPLLPYPQARQGGAGVGVDRRVKWSTHGGEAAGPPGSSEAPAQPPPDPSHPGPQTLLPPCPPRPNSLPVGPTLVGSGRRWPHTGGRSLHDPGWDGRDRDGKRIRARAAVGPGQASCGSRRSLPRCGGGGRRRLAAAGAVAPSGPGARASELAARGAH